MLGDISSVVTLICRPGKITLPAEFTGKAPEGFFPVVFSFEPDDDSLTCRIQCDDASFVKCRYVPSIYGSFTGAVKLVLKDGSSLPVFREIQRLRAEGSAEVLAECNGYPAAVRNHFGKGTTELWGTCLTMNFGADLSKIIPDFAEKNGVNIPVRIKSGKNLIASCCRAEMPCWPFFPSLTKESQQITAALPVTSGEILTPAAASWCNGELVLRIEPYETTAVIISTNA